MAKFQFSSLLVVLITAMAMGAVASRAGAVDRKWQNGLWRESHDERTYVIAGATVRVHFEDVPPGAKRAIAVTAGTSAKFAIEGTRVFVVDARGVEREFGLVRSVDLNYTATGGGHYIKAMALDGLIVTLEDNSVWELDPRSQFFTVEWQPFEGISVRRSDSEQNFNYEIDNTERDDGALARYSPP
jgi:hypothetical protein